MNADPDSSLHKPEFISMLAGGGGGSETALFISSSICTLFSSSAPSKTECPRQHDHLEAKYTFTSISAINSHHWHVLLLSCLPSLYFICKKATLTEVNCLA